MAKITNLLANYPVEAVRAACRIIYSRNKHWPTDTEFAAAVEFEHKRIKAGKTEVVNRHDCPHCDNRGWFQAYSQGGQNICSVACGCQRGVEMQRTGGLPSFAAAHAQGYTLKEKEWRAARRQRREEK